MDFISANHVSYCLFCCYVNLKEDGWAGLGQGLENERLSCCFAVCLVRLEYVASLPSLHSFKVPFSSLYCGNSLLP